MLGHALTMTHSLWVINQVEIRWKAARSDIETLITHPFWKGKIKDSDLSKTSKPILSESINIKNSLMEPNHLKSSFRKMFDFISRMKIVRVKNLNWLQEQPSLSRCRPFLRQEHFLVEVFYPFDTKSLSLQGHVMHYHLYHEWYQLFLSIRRHNRLLL